METRYNRYSSPIKPAVRPDIPPNEKTDNIVLIAMDSVRIDSFTKQNCPNIFEFCKDGTFFSRAYASANWTLPSHTSMLTGLYPSCHEAVSRRFMAYKPTPDYLPNVLRQLGYWCQGFVRMNFLHAKFGLGFAFDSYEQHNLATAEEIFKLCRPTQEPFFIFINLGDTHSPFVCPTSLEKTCNGDKNSAYNHGKIEKNDDYFNDMRTEQDKCLQYIDSIFPSFIKSLPQNTKYIITSDHGELFGEESQFGHSGILHPKVLHVPLVTNFHVNCNADDIISLNEIYSIILNKVPNTGWAITEHFDSPSFQHPKTALKKSLMLFWKEQIFRWRKGNPLSEEQWQVIESAVQERPDLKEQLIISFTKFQQKDIIKRIKTMQGDANN